MILQKMKLFSTLLYLIPSALFVSAGTVQSPTQGATLSNSEPFNLTYTSDKYFKENTESITVLLSKYPFKDSLKGVVLIEALPPDTYSTGTYSAELTPEFFYPGFEPGQYDVVVLEKYYSYAGVDAYDVNTQTVTFEWA